MKTVKEKSAELLAELRDLCNKNGLQYWLSPMTTGWAYTDGGFGEDFFIPGIVMPVDDALRLKKIVEVGTVPNRSIECMENNSQFTTFSMTYVNEETTLINIIRGSDYSKHGVRVNIDILRPAISDKAIRRQEMIWECTGYLRVMSIKHHAINPPARIYANMRKKNGGTRTLYEKMVRTYQNVNSNDYYLKLYHKDGVTLAKSLFENYGEIEFEGEKYRVPSEVERYLQQSTKGTWKSKPARLLRYIYYEYIPYREIEARFVADGDSIDGHFTRNEAWYNRSTEQVKYTSEKNRLWNLANRSGMRAIIYNDLNKQIDTIRQLREDKNYAELEKLFEDYDVELHRLLNGGLGLCPNKELLDIECELMEARGEGSAVEKLRSLVPAEHYKSPQEIENEIK